jgi:hypothetical protein
VNRLLAAAAALALALPAAAQSPVIVSRESPRWGSFQLSLSPFSPNIDSEFQGALYPPYATVFGTGRPLMVQLVFSKSAWMTEVGTLDIGFGAAYWQVWGQGYYQDTTGNITRGGSTSLMIIPLQLNVSYRVDWFYERFSVPLAPYVRFAIVDDIWSSSGQSGVSSWTDPSTGTAYRASGATFGWSATLGIALVLDFFDTQLSRQMDFDTGINRTMLFIDFTKSSVNDFGSSKSWQLAPSYWQWAAGLLFVF